MSLREGIFGKVLDEIKKINTVFDVLFHTVSVDHNIEQLEVLFRFKFKCLRNTFSNITVFLGSNTVVDDFLVKTKNSRYVKVVEYVQHYITPQ